MNYLMNHALKRPKFAALLVKHNICLDMYSKRAVLKASPSIVGLISYSGKEEIFQGSGTIIESDGNSGVILTSATLIRCRMGRNSVADDVKVVAHLSNGHSFDCQILAFDFHYNIAALKIQSESDAPLPTACLAHLDDSISVDPNQLYIREEKPFQLRPHSKSFNLIPGDTLIALGRYFIKPYDVMATTGEFSLDCCEYDCKELLRVNCQITRCGIGGPFINYYGEVMGICFHDMGFTPFLPINVASKWWEHYKRCGEPRRPWLGMEVTNLYAADVDILEKIVQKFPNVFKGVIVEEVMAGSSADSAGISPNDVIVQFGGKTIKSFLELFEAMWDKVGDPVEVIVIRASNSVPLRLSMVVDEATSDNLYSWPLWEHAR
ncbi:hypothetical protein MANES_S095408v8 [Manihot esculenta]|nr:hypothetical protein MANES_S095408v8 [Manihot esculenta]